MRAALLILLLVAAPATAQRPLPKAPGFDYGQEQPASRVVIVTMAGCAPCERVKAALRPLAVETDLQVIDYAVWNKQAGAELRVEVAPTVFVWANVKKPGKRYVGGGTSLSQVRAALAGKQQQAAATRGTGRGGWTWPGMPSVAALEKHLAGPPHNYLPSKLRSMTDEQLIQLHDDWHNSRRSGRNFARRRS